MHRSPCSGTDIRTSLPGRLGGEAGGTGGRAGGGAALTCSQSGSAPCTRGPGPASGPVFCCVAQPSLKEQRAEPHEPSLCLSLGHTSSRDPERSLGHPHPHHQLVSPPEWLWKHRLWGRPVTPDLSFLICEMGTITIPTSQGYCELKRDEVCLFKKMCVCVCLKKCSVFSPSSYRHRDWAPFKKAMLGTQWMLQSREERKQQKEVGRGGEKAQIAILSRITHNDQLSEK